MSKKTVMVIDDMKENLTLMNNTLLSEGYDVRIFSNPLLALKSLSETVIFPDLILLDINMPQMNGYDVCKIIKEIEDLRVIPIIFLSALDDKFDKVKGFESGAVDYITKPFAIEELLLRVKTHIEIRELQKKLKESNRILEQKVIERTIELEKELEEKKKAVYEAEKANKIKTQFLANMSHEMRTPLNGIMGMTEILEMSEPTEQQMDYIKSMKEAENILLKIIEDILDIAKIESGKIEIGNHIFDIKKSIESVVDLNNYNAVKKGIKLKSRIDKDIPDIVSGDETFFKRILINVIGNAVKFTKKGEVNLETKKVYENDREIEIKITVQDTGIGMNDETKKKIFHPFVQGDMTFTKEYQGTGLGLVITKKLLDLMNGEIYFISEEGKGSTFFISIIFEKN